MLNKLLYFVKNEKESDLQCKEGKRIRISRYKDWMIKRFFGGRVENERAESGKSNILTYCL